MDAHAIDAIRFELDRKKDLRVTYDTAGRKAAFAFVQKVCDTRVSRRWGAETPPENMSPRNTAQHVQSGADGMHAAAIDVEMGELEPVQKETLGERLLDGRSPNFPGLLAVLKLMLGHTRDAKLWRMSNGLPRHLHQTIDQASAVSCAIELLLAAGMDADGLYPSHAGEHPSDAETNVYGLLHLLASGGCDPDMWEDTPVALPAALQSRLIRWCVRLGAHVELRDSIHWATPLTWSCWFSCRAGAMAMLGVGANRDALDRYGTTSRALAAHRAHVDLDEVLDPDAPTLDEKEELPPPHHQSDEHLLSRRRDVVANGRAALRRVHAGWAEEEARIDAARGARGAAKACDVVLDGRMLPGPALQAVADALLLEGFVLWPPVTRAVVAEGW